MNHQNLMQRCIDLGQKALGKTYPNPNVGCLLFYDGKIISEGFTSQHGENHAEINVINNINDYDILKKSTLFVTLEPCSHYGKTPPCCNAIFKKNIKNVIIGCKDPNVLVNGGGINFLKDNNVSVKYGVLENECKELHKRFFTFHKKRRPYIILKWAETNDGFISPTKNKSGRPYWISNNFSRQLVHKWRSQEHAILVGGTTYRTDNPILDSRNWDKNNPSKFVITRSGKIHNKNFQLISNNHKLKIDELNKSLFKKNIQSIIVEGGKKTLDMFIKNNCWDEVRIIKNEKKIFEGIKSPKKNLEPNNEFKINDDLIQIFFN
tara:strand:+ start:21965 stop:22927 length:963 start_codon:yes stop_codon:yes gene_type:complete